MGENNKSNDLIKYIIFGFVILNLAPALVPIVILFAALYFIFKVKNKQEGVHYQDFFNSNNMEQNFNFGDISRKMRTGVGSLVVLVIIIVVLINAIKIVPPGHTGVYHVFGKVRDAEISSGIHLINPLATVRMMSIRTEQYTMSVAPSEGQVYGDDAIDALTKEGLKVRLDMTVLYHLEEEMASDVYRDIGESYEEKILRPQVRSAIREVIAQYEAKDIYSDKRKEAVDKISEILTASMAARGIVIEEILLRNVALPAMLTQAIEAKLTAEQEAQKYDFVLQKEEKEAERKRIEAAGQRDAQQIINQSLTDRYLQYLYIKDIKDREGTIYVPTNMPLFKGV